MKSSDEMQLARAYFKIQQYTRRFSPMEGLKKGTIFPELYLPYGPHHSGKKEPEVNRKGARFFGQKS